MCAEEDQGEAGRKREMRILASTEGHVQGRVTRFLITRPSAGIYISL